MRSTLLFCLGGRRPVALAPERLGAARCSGGAMVGFVALRCALLLTLDNSEPRYTLEFFPLLIVWASFLFRSGLRIRQADADAAQA